MKAGDTVYVKATVTLVSQDYLEVVPVGAMYSITAHVGEVMVPTLGQADFRVSKNHPATSKAVEPKIREGSLQRDMLLWFDSSPLMGWTDDELEVQMERSHQSVSATRNTLVRKGLVHNTGMIRKTRSGNDAIVWGRTAVEVAS